MINYKIQTATKKNILNHLNECDTKFIPKLSSLVNLKDFAGKIFDLCVIFEAWDDNHLIGLVTAYFNNEDTKISYINNVSILADYANNGIATKLLLMCIDYGEKNNFKEIHLEVSEENIKAISLYRKFGFVIFKEVTNKIYMKYSYENKRS